MRKANRPEDKPVVGKEKADGDQRPGEKRIGLEESSAKSATAPDGSEDSDDKPMSEEDRVANAPTVSEPVANPQQPEPREEKMASQTLDSRNDQQPASAPETGSAGVPAAGNPPSEPEAKRISLADLLTDEEPRILPAVKRPPLPEAKTLQTATEKALKLFGGEAKNAKTAQAQLALAQNMFVRARWSHDEPDVRYVLLRQAVDLAVSNGHAVMACRALESIAELHDVPDLMRERANIVSKAATIRDASDKTAWANTLLALSLADAAADLDRFDVANNLFRVITVLSKSRSRAFKEKTAAFKKSLLAREKRRAAYKQALVKLKNRPDDREANLAAGRYELLVAGEWKAGVERWHRLKEPPLDELLALEAKARRNSTERLAAARAWWNAASDADAAWRTDSTSGQVLVPARRARGDDLVERR